MINKTLFSIFKQGSKTYFYSSLFFPTYLKKDVFSLYGFVRKADNFVDSKPQDINGFYDFKEKYYSAIEGKKTNNIVIDSFVDLAYRKNFNPEWTDAFLKSMESDIKKSRYKSIDETIDYMYGSAEVIGLFMAKIMSLPDEALYHAKYLGRSMQYINFIRDIAEDLTLGRIYMPEHEMEKIGIKKLDYDYVKKIPKKFISFIHTQLNYYCKWQKIAEEGYKYIPKRYLIPIKTASEMYNWTAGYVYKNPFVIYCKKIKPMIKQILTTTLLNMIDPEKPNYKLDICSLQTRMPHFQYLEKL
jgi:phytoene synthase